MKQTYGLISNLSLSKINMSAHTFTCLGTNGVKKPSIVSHISATRHPLYGAGEARITEEKIYLLTRCSMVCHNTDVLLMCIVCKDITNKAYVKLYLRVFTSFTSNRMNHQLKRRK